MLIFALKSVPFCLFQNKHILIILYKYIYEMETRLQGIKYGNNKYIYMQRCQMKRWRPCWHNQHSIPQILGSNMKKAKAKWQWYRLGHNPGLVRINNGKHTIGVFHTLPCSFLKNHQRIEREKFKAHIPEEENRSPLSKFLRDALRCRVQEDIEDWSQQSTERGK